MKERVTYRGRAEVKAEESAVAFEIYQMPISALEKLAVWKERTGLERAAYYRALRRLGK